MSMRRANVLLAALALVLLVTMVCLRYHLGPRKISYWCTGAVTIDGLTYYLHPDDRIITSALVDSGVWEPLETSVLQSELRPGDTFIDVGANIGYYTVMAAKLVGPQGRVIAFEPDPINFAILEGMQTTLRRHEETRLLVEFFPMLLHSFGYDPAHVLEGLQSLGFTFDDLNSTKRQVVPTSIAELLAQHKTDKASYTNLLVQRPARSGGTGSLSARASDPQLAVSGSGQPSNR